MKLRSILCTLLFLGVLVFSMSDSYAADMSKATIITPTNIRVEANPSALVISKMAEGQEVFILETNGDWVKVRLDNGFEGYVSNLDIEIKEVEKRKVTVAGVNIRAKASVDSDSLKIVNTGDELSLLEANGEWAKVEFNGARGYIQSKYLTRLNENNQVNRGSSRQVTALIEMAKSLQGKPYVYGSNGPNSFDCSGFVSYVYKNAVGISLPRVSRDQARSGSFVTMANLMPGDIVSFDTNGGRNSVSHVGIYIGDGEFIHAASTGSWTVKTDSLYSNYYSNTFMGGARILN